jgi:1-acyl-sn-glycerol-3-phosphate acyltransferase
MQMMNTGAIKERPPVAENGMAKTVETRIATRAILRQLQCKRSGVVLPENTYLNQREVGRFLADHAKIMFLAASAANLPLLKQKAELLFYDAYLVAEGTAEASLAKDD